MGRQIFELHPDGLIFNAPPGMRIEHGIGGGGTNGTEDTRRILREIEKTLRESDNLREAAAAGPEEQQILFAFRELWSARVILPGVVHCASGQRHIDAAVPGALPALHHLHSVI